MTIADLLIEAVERHASDVIISAGAPVTYHVHGLLESGSSANPLTGTETEDLVYQMLSPGQRKEFEQERELDLSFHLRDIARFRVSVYRQKGTVAAVLRVIPFRVPHYTEIGIPERFLMQMVNTPHGLILITGPTGAGKSTTIASFLEYLNTEGGLPRHIITIEDPIEFLMTSKVCVIDQRELGSDTSSYVRGLKSALRQMPHIIFVGEMRDRATMEVALTAAETGNLVLSTLSTQSASKTINRIIDVFPLEEQAEIRARLALTLRIVVSQVLLPRVDRRGRIAAREVLILNSSASNLIREGKIHQLNNVIASSAAEGMVLLDDTLLELHSQGIVGAADVAARIQDGEKMRLLVDSV
jgi:twitching motility protein PilT